MQVLRLKQLQNHPSSQQMSSWHILYTPVWIFSETLINAYVFDRRLQRIRNISANLSSLNVLAVN